MLLNRGADPDHIAFKSARYRALHIAARSGSGPIVRMLLEAGASEDAKLAGPDGDAPLHLAISNYQEDSRYLEAARILLEFGANVNGKNHHNIGPLHIAICLRSQCEDMVQLLLDFGGKMNKMDESEESASHYSDLLSAYWWAICSDRPKIVELLVRKNPRLLNEISEQGFNGLQTYMNRYRPDCENDALCVLFVKLGLNPFKRQQDDQLSCFELGIRSRRGMAYDFLEACVDHLNNDTESLHVTLKELRIATEIDEPDLWTMLESYMKGIEDETDEDDWNIHHFLHQAKPRKNYSEYEKSALKKTLLPTALGWPTMWEEWSKARKPRIEADGLEIVFQGKRSTATEI